MRTYQVDVPEGTSGAVTVERFTVTKEDDIRQLGSLFKSGRYVPPGEYTRLTCNGQIWMSDTPNEWHDHLKAAYQITSRGGRILINGLGLGVIVKHALDCGNVKHVDVVEIDADVIKLVGPTYEGPRCAIHHADAYEQAKKWPRGSHWSVAWHDIWGDVSTDALPEMARLKRSLRPSRRLARLLVSRATTARVASNTRVATVRGKKEHE